MIGQLIMSLNLPPAPNPAGLFWCCGDCMPKSRGQTSLMWKPPDYTRGVCCFCGRSYQFDSELGEAELAAEVGG